MRTLNFETTYENHYHARRRYQFYGNTDKAEMKMKRTGLKRKTTVSVKCIVWYKFTTLPSMDSRTNNRRMRNTLDFLQTNRILDWYGKEVHHEA